VLLSGSWLRYNRRHKLLATSKWINGWIFSFSPKLNVSFRTMRGSFHGKFRSQFLNLILLNFFLCFLYLFCFVSYLFKGFDLVLYSDMLCYCYSYIESLLLLNQCPWRLESSCYQIPWGPLYMGWQCHLWQSAKSCLLRVMCSRHTTFWEGHDSGNRCATTQTRVLSSSLSSEKFLKTPLHGCRVNE